jgi:hypothetical protein
MIIRKYLSPAAAIRRVELEEWIATTPEVSGAIGSSTVNWTSETTYGVTPASEGGDVYFSW